MASTRQLTRSVLGTARYNVSSRNIANRQEMNKTTISTQRVIKPNHNQKLANIKITKTLKPTEEPSRKVITFRDEKESTAAKSDLENSKIRNLFVKQGRKIQANHRRDNMSYLVKEAQYYFEKNPTYLKDIEVGQVQNMELKKYVESVGASRNPIFGYSHLTYEDQNSPDVIQERKEKFIQFLIGTNSAKKKAPVKRVEIKDRTSSEEDDDDYNDNHGGNNNNNRLPFQPALNYKRKDDRIFKHIMKCFTFGKKLKRQMEEDSDKVSRVEILKKRFQRLSLLREYFSVEKRDQPRKFEYPICEDTSLIKGKPLDIYDELQYCEESDFEECMRPTKKRLKEMKILKQQQQEADTLDLDYIDNSKRFDDKMTEQLSKLLKQEDDFGLEYSRPKVEDEDSEDTFDGLSQSDSVCSTPRQRAEKEMLAFDKLMPFDFYTHRKAKQFFKEDILDIGTLLTDPKFSLKNKDLQGNPKVSQSSIQNKDENAYFDDNEHAKLKDLPELNEDLKQMYAIKAEPILQPNEKKHRQLQPSLTSTQSIRDKSLAFKNYHYTQKVQCTQIRNMSSEVESLHFQRVQSKNLRSKRQLLEKLVEFKQKIEPQQIQALRQRQFVIIDMNQPLPKSVQRRRNNVRKVIVEQPAIILGRNVDAIAEIKQNIIKEKVKRAKFLEIQNKLKAGLFKKLVTPGKAIQTQKQGILSASTASATPQLTNSRNNLSPFPQRYQTTGGSTLEEIPEVVAAMPTVDLKNYLNDQSPYTEILAEPENFGLLKNEQLPKKPRKFMLEKLKRRSILNCELFKETKIGDTKPKTMQNTKKYLQTQKNNLCRSEVYMTENIGQTIGLKYMPVKKQQKVFDV